MIAPFPRRFVFLGCSITSDWGNTHAPVYRTLLRALVARGHHVLFLERLGEEAIDRLTENHAAEGSATRSERDDPA